MRFHSLDQNNFRSAFSLIEILVVMAIMGILLYLTIPATMSLQQSSNLSVAGQTVADEIAVAREMAASRNVVVEVRFLTPTTWAALGPPYTGYHALQLWAPNESGTSAQADRVITLPDGVEISANSSLSPLLSTLVAAKVNMPNGTTAGTYVSFFVRPAGTIEVANTPANQAANSSSEDNTGARAPFYFFTILPVRYDNSSTPPANYFTIQLNPDTGRTESYRP